MRATPLANAQLVAEFAYRCESRPLETEQILRALDDAGVAYVLIGGTACIIHGAEQTTMDTDVLPALDDDNLRRLLSALDALGAAVLVDARRLELEAGEPWEVQSLRRGPDGFRDADAWHFTTDAGLVDVVMRAAGVGEFGDHLPNATQLTVFGMSVRVAGLDDIIRSKETLQREKDLTVLRQLRRIRDENEANS